jgi:HEAT repeat protein
MKDGDNDSDGGEDELDDEQLEKLEFIIQYLLDALKDDDNIVRWTAAKGIGRITMRLSKDFADQIVE